MTTITLRLTVQQAVEVHTHCDMAARDYEALARRTRGLPIVAEMFRKAAHDNATIARYVEEQCPSLTEHAERPGIDPSGPS